MAAKIGRIANMETGKWGGDEGGRILDTRCWMPDNFMLVMQVIIDVGYPAFEYLVLCSV